MFLTIITILVINLLLSIDNIIPIVLLVDTLEDKSKKTFALLFGLLGGMVMRIILLLIASLIFKIGNIIYIFVGIFLLYLGIRGLMNTKDKGEQKSYKSAKLLNVIFYIILIDVSLSLDNTAALIAITRNIFLLGLGLVSSVVILFGLSFSINAVVERVKGLDIAAYIAIVFLGAKFLAFPFGINISSEFTSAIILLICLITTSVVYMRKRLTKHAS